MTSRVGQFTADCSRRAGLRAAAGAALGLLITGAVCGMFVPAMTVSTLWLVAPMGATAVLIFAVPASPLAQPWPVIGGCVVSAVVGTAVHMFGDASALAGAAATGIAIILMTLCRCLHPPGGAVALLAALHVGPADELGWVWPLFPVLVNASLLTLVAVLFHRFGNHAYPHHVREVPAEPLRSDPIFAVARRHLAEDVDAALASLEDPLDISREDAQALVQDVLHRVEARIASTDRR